MEKLLNALGHDVKKSGRGWIARCPVHGDKDFAMSIKQSDSGSVLAYCHACGANGKDLYETLGLDLGELMGYQERNDGYIPQKIREQYNDDLWFTAIFEAAKDRGEPLQLSDKKRYRLATARIKGVNEKWGIKRVHN